MIKYALSFLKLGPKRTDSCGDTGVFNNDFDEKAIEILPPCMTPFTSSPHTGKIKAMKIFGTVKMELLKMVKVSNRRKQDLKTMRTHTKSSSGLKIELDEKSTASPTGIYNELCKRSQQPKKLYSSRLSMKLKNRLKNQL